jgi:hypothetical protein
MVWWRTDLTPIICLKKMLLIFIKAVKRLATNIIRFYQNIKNNVMPISGTRIAMKRGIGGLFSIIVKN